MSTYKIYLAVWQLLRAVTRWNATCTNRHNSCISVADKYSQMCTEPDMCLAFKVRSKMNSSGGRTLFHSGCNLSDIPGCLSLAISTAISLEADTQSHQVAPFFFPLIGTVVSLCLRAHHFSHSLETNIDKSVK